MLSSAFTNTLQNWPLIINSALVLRRKIQLIKSDAIYTPTDSHPSADCYTLLATKTIFSLPHCRSPCWAPDPQSRQANGAVMSLPEAVAEASWTEQQSSPDQEHQSFHLLAVEHSINRPWNNGPNEQSFHQPICLSKIVNWQFSSPRSIYGNTDLPTM